MRNAGALSQPLRWSSADATAAIVLRGVFAWETSASRSKTGAARILCPSTATWTEMALAIHSR